MAMQSADREGYDVLQDHFAEFCGSGVDPVSTAAKLFQAKLINASVRDESTAQSGRRDLQLKTIIDAVMRQGKPGAFQEFTEIIATDSSWLANKFKSAYIDRGGKWSRTRAGRDHVILGPDRTFSVPRPDPPLEELSCLRREATYPRSAHPPSHNRGHAPCHPETRLKLKDIFDSIKTLAAEEWKDIGEALHIEDLESIPSKPGITKNDEAYLREVLRRWLDTPAPSIKHLIKALRDCYREEAAKALESLFVIGESPDTGLDCSLPSNIAEMSLLTPMANPYQESSSFRAPRYSEEEMSPLGPSEMALDLKPEVFTDGLGTRHEKYKMKSNPHGIALVISNTRFTEGSRLSCRESALVDEQRVKTIFETLKYTVILLRDLTAAQMVEAFQLVVGKMTFNSFSQSVQEVWRRRGYNGDTITKSNDSFVCCFLSHGGRGVVYGIDRSCFGIELEDFSKILGPQACPLLTGKPKMVFIQCCQGENTAVPAVVEGDGPSHLFEHKRVHRDGSSIVTITEKSDFCISYASVCNEKSYRSQYTDPTVHREKGGSWYIHALHEAIITRHVRSIPLLTTVINRLVTEKEEVDEDNTVLKQCPVVKSTLRYDVHF